MLLLLTYSYFLSGGSQLTRSNESFENFIDLGAISKDGEPGMENMFSSRYSNIDFICFSMTKRIAQFSYEISKNRYPNKFFTFFRDFFKLFHRYRDIYLKTDTQNFHSIDELPILSFVCDFPISTSRVVGIHTNGHINSIKFLKDPSRTDTFNLNFLSFLLKLILRGHVIFVDCAEYVII